MSEMLDLLLGGDMPDVRRNLPSKRCEVVTASERLGKPFVVTLQALPYGRIRQLRQMNSEDLTVQILLAGCKDPDFRDKRLLDPERELVTPEDVVKSVLLPGEIEEISAEIEKLSGFRRRTIADVKNG